MRIPILLAIIILLTLSSCKLLTFIPPSSKRFEYYLPSQINKINPNLRTEGYYFNIEKDNFYNSEDILKFNNCGIISHVGYASTSNSQLDTVIIFNNNEDIKIDNCILKNTEHRGYYYCKNDSIFYEYAAGLSGIGYFFIYGEGKIVDSNHLSLKETKNIRFRNAMGRSEYNLDNKPKIYTFRKFDVDSSKNANQ
jgi:hypothetical protein